MPAPFKDFVRDYLEAVYPDVIPPMDAALLAEMFVSYITRTCLRVNVHEGAEENSRQVTREAREVMALSVDTIAELCMLHVRRARGGFLSLGEQQDILWTEFQPQGLRIFQSGPFLLAQLNAQL